MASRNAGTPHVTGYWLWSSAIARAAASFTSCGAGKSGNPWPKLIAPWRFASLVISRITDSVNEEAFADARRFDMRRMIAASLLQRAAERPELGEEPLVEGAAEVADAARATGAVFGPDLPLDHEHVRRSPGREALVVIEQTFADGEELGTVAGHRDE